MREKFLQNLRLHLIDLSRRLEQDPSDDVADDVLYRLQQVASHLSRTAGSASGNVIDLNVPLGFASGNLRVSGKQNSLFPLWPVIKCLLLENKKKKKL